MTQPRLVASESLEVYGALEELGDLEPDWNALAASAKSPFLTTQWLKVWWRAFGRGRLVSLALRDGDGSLGAGGVFARSRGRLVGTANYHSGSWDVVSRDERAHAELLRQVAGARAPVVVLPTMLGESTPSVAARAFRSAGYRMLREPAPVSPFLALPASFEELLAAASSNLRSQFGRKRRALERKGELVLRSYATPRDVDAKLETFFAIEGSGWKTRSGTAILSDPSTERFYRELARAAASEGWLRLRLLELEGAPIAGDYSLVFAGGEFLLKTGFDTSYASLSPGLVLRGEILRAAIDERLDFYDFLGGPDQYKLRWTDEVRPRVTLRAFRGAAALPAFVYRSRVRPVLKSVRRRL